MPVSTAPRRPPGRPSPSAGPPGGRARNSAASTPYPSDSGGSAPPGVLDAHYAGCNARGGRVRKGSGNVGRGDGVATPKRRRNSITRLIEDVVDDAKDLVDDVVDRAKDVERDGRKAVRRAVKDESNGSDTSAREMDDLKSALDDLTAKVERLVAMQADARKQNP